ncbi:MAG: hypothetical protein ACMXX8_00760 [Candidatus Woesearchaeota archaeon]
MKFKKIRTIILIMVCLLLFIGCGRQGYRPANNPYQGSEGLNLRFVRNTPPDNVYELDVFPVGLILENRGAYDIERGVINFNVETDYIEKPIFEDYSIYLKGKSIHNIEGEEETRLFYFETKKMDVMSQIRRSTISVLACYEYGTTLKTEVCIDPDVYDILRDRTKPCTVKEESFSGQGAPVGVVKLVPQITPDINQDNVIIPQFELTIRNLNRGNVINTYSVYNYCSNERISREDFNKVEIRAKLGGINLECNPPIVQMNDRGEGKTICLLRNGIQGASTAYNSLLEVDLRYGYTSVISTDFRINRR